MHPLWGVRQYRTGDHSHSLRVKGPVGACLASMDISNANHLALQNLQISEQRKGKSYASGKKYLKRYIKEMAGPT
eukprot:717368-Pelagomonas_calceolata.AAC.1